MKVGPASSPFPRDDRLRWGGGEMYSHVQKADPGDWLGVLVSKGCTNKVLQTGWLKTTQTYCLTILEAAAAAAKLLQSCPTLCDPIDGRPPGSPIPGIL